MEKGEEKGGEKEEKGGIRERKGEGKGEGIREEREESEWHEKGMDKRKYLHYKSNNDKVGRKW